MIRLLTLIFGLSFAVPSFGVGAADQDSGLGWNNFSVEEYQVRCDNLCVLVSDADQRWLYLTNKMGVYSQAYRDRAIADCKALSKKPSTCRVIDENLESDFIRNFSNSSEQIATNPDTTKTVQPLAVAEAQPTEADKNIETDGDVASDDIYNQSGPSLGALLEALQAFDQLMQSEVEEQFPGSSGSASIEMAQNTSSEVSPASRAFSIESKSPETENIRGLWKSDANCYVHIYETYDGSLGGAAWGGQTREWRAAD